jgi:hypothetical protein
LGRVPGIHPQSTFLHSRLRRENRMGATVKEKIQVDFFAFFKQLFFQYESEEGAWTSFDSNHTTEDLFHYDVQHKL